ncbi:heavy-metal-associated domain-containing protein [Flindersiella endophytica]
MSVTTTYIVSGMTCDHCAHAVSSELKGVAGVSDVTVDLTSGGESKVTVVSADPIADDQVSTALEEAGDYRLVRP